jgi:xanthine dehydrogenase YagT iron-sulfur-binding subunit
MEPENPSADLTRRDFIGATTIATGVLAGCQLVDAQSAESLDHARYSLTINGVRHEFAIDTRVTLLDLIRERLHLMGTKKGCDHGQCGACTVLANGTRINSCLALAVSHDGDHITTIEGLSAGAALHPMQAAFLEHDGFQCGFCTSGQICSAVACLDEARHGIPSAVTKELSRSGPIALSEDEVRERMAGNICRCAAYPNIVAAIRAVSSQG